MSHLYKTAHQTEIQHLLQQLNVPLYYSKPVMNQLVHFTEGILANGFSGTLTDIYRESCHSHNRRTLSHFLAHVKWDEHHLMHVVQESACPFSKTSIFLSENYIISVQKMVSVDEHTQVAMEVIAQSLKISEQTLLRLLEALSKLLEGKEQQPKDFIFDDKTKAEKQKISDFMKKHEKTGGIVALDENLTKQQLNDYQKELKKLGVDFSVVRNGKEDYSFFFSAAQANVIEKALKNIVERKSAVLEKEEVKTAEKKEPKENNINYDCLSKQEKLLYAKLEELDEIKRGLYSQEVNRVEKLFENRYKQDVETDTTKEKTEVEINAKDNKEHEGVAKL
ncbi:DUF3801 domain-containing protein [Bacillus mycoides]|uniref:DUF3801 domain-containing protein n=1 Tax=Bacillus mycoides TaxID=1405 RepID=UPI001F2931C1|nr:DUF3801 domain-containing protein [Bacillus mycoides]